MESLTTYLSSFETISALFISLVDMYGMIALIIGVLFLGETVILIALLLTQQGVLSIGEVLIASAIGTLLADTFWFSIGRYYPPFLMPKLVAQRLLIPADALFTNIIGARIFLSLLLLRFFIGTRLIIILYLSRYKITWPRFLIYDFLGTLIYLATLTVIGVFLGRTIANVVPAFQIMTSILSGILIIIIISAVARRVLYSLKQTPTNPYV